MKASKVVSKLLEAVDPDDPSTMVQTQPGFEFRHTMFSGMQVLVKGVGRGETEDAWPWPIGHVVQGPDGRWYVIDIYGVTEEQLPQLGYGTGRYAHTFDTQESAALAIWLMRQRMGASSSTRGKRRLPKDFDYANYRKFSSA